jgi:hypothetical protein
MKLNAIRSRWIWPGVILVSAAATSLFFFLGIASPLRLITTLWFLLMCPGMAFVRLLRLEVSYYEWTLAVIMSISVDGIVASLLVYAHLWSIELSLSILIVLSLLGACLQILGARPQRSMAESPEEDVSR